MQISELTYLTFVSFSKFYGEMQFSPIEKASSLGSFWLFRLPELTSFKPMHLSQCEFSIVSCRPFVSSQYRSLSLSMSWN